MSKMNLEFLSVNASSREVSDYIECFEIWAITQDNLAEENKAAYFLNAISKDTYALVKNLVYPDIPIKMPLAKIQEAIIQHVQPIAFEAAERSIFHTIMRRSDQNIRDFILLLQTLAAKCNFEAQLDTQLRDRLITCINDPNLQRQ